MYKVFFNNNVVLISEQEENVDPSFECLNLDEINFQKLQTELLSEDVCKNYFIKVDNIENTWKQFKKSFKYIEAGGGIVQNRNGENLMIFRRGKWDLPKGKREEGESALFCAKREIEEECGIGNLVETGKIIDTYHTYVHKGKVILKKTFWFSFKYSGNEKPKPQEEEDISEVVWVEVKDIHEKMQNTFPSILMVFQQAGIV